MTYSSDKPINKISEDLLGRAPFSFQLAKAITNYKENSGLVIGIYGSWGTGKTSIINMIENEISNFEDDKTIFIRFSPWNYSDKDSLIRLFFESLKIKLNIQRNKKINNAIDNYLEALDILTIFPFFNTNLVGIFKKIIKSIRNNNEISDLETNKRSLEKHLVETNKKIIVVIDDLDRLTNIQIREIFQLVKQVADFPNLIYILSMDRDVVARALTEVQNIDGNDYLEKIVQIPFEIPKIGKDKLQNILNNKIENIINSSNEKIDININYWSKVYFKCIEPYINTIRDVNRVINTFQFRFPVLIQETCFEDLFAITVLEVLEPKLYKWIRENKTFLLSQSYSTDDFEFVNKQINDEFIKLNIDVDRAKGILSVLFPLFEKKINKYFYDLESNKNIRSRMGIAHQNRFELYFKFNLEEIKITRNIINDCIYKFDYKELYITINEIIFRGDSVYFLDEINCLLDKIPYERISLISTILIELSVFFDGVRADSFFTTSTSNIVLSLIFDLLNKLNTKNEIYQVLYSSISKLNKYGLGIMSLILIKFEEANNKKNGVDEHYKILELEKLKICKEFLINRIKQIVKVEQLWHIEFLYSVFKVWESIDIAGIRSYTFKLFSQDINKLKYLCSIASDWYGETNKGWHFYESLYNKYFSKEEIYKIIDELEEEEFSLFSNLEQSKLAYFYANYHINDMEQYNEEVSLQIYNNRFKKN